MINEGAVSFQDTKTTLGEKCLYVREYEFSSLAKKTGARGGGGLEINSHPPTCAKLKRGSFFKNEIRGRTSKIRKLYESKGSEEINYVSKLGVLTSPFSLFKIEEY